MLPLIRAVGFEDGSVFFGGSSVANACRIRLEILEIEKIGISLLEVFSQEDKRPQVRNEELFVSELHGKIGFAFSQVAFRYRLRVRFQLTRLECHILVPTLTHLTLLR